jgi:type VI secretion system VasD/TssJ family lipoprotein
MIYVKQTMLLLYAVTLLLACSSAPRVKQPPEWGYEKEAISLHFTGDRQLNLFQKQPHSLVVCLYHLRDPNSFHQLADEKDGLPKLLDCNRFDPSVTFAKRLVLQPGQNLLESLDRTEGAKFVGLVAGYYPLQKEGSVRVYPIPIAELQTDAALVQKAAKLSIDLHLGPHEIMQSAENSKSRQP